MAAPGQLDVAAPAARARRTGLARWRALALETYVTLPLFAGLLLVLLWVATFHVIDAGRQNALATARDANRELLDTYEAQVARNLAAIDQTLKMVKYAVELKGPAGALPALNEKGLLPSGLVFVVSLVDRNGMTTASHPAAKLIDVSDQDYFRYHRDSDSDAPFVSQTMRDAANPEWHVHFTRRLNDAAGNFAGIAIVEVDPGYFTSAYEHSRQGERGMLGVFGQDGVFRVLRIGDNVTYGTSAPGAFSDSWPGISAWDGVRRFMTMRRLHGYPLSVAVGLAEDEQLAPFRANRRNFLLAASAASAVLVLIVALICLWSWQLARTRHRVRRAQETYAAASEASLDAFFVMRSMSAPDGTVTDFVLDAVNSRAAEMTGLDKQRVRGKSLLAIAPQCRENGLFDDLVKAMREGGVHEAEWENDLPGSDVQWLHRQVVAVEGGVVAIVRDISDRKRTEERILHMAHHDELTGLPNRSLIRDRLDQAILHSQRKQRAVALAFIDLDGFKLVNDGLGHNAGDELLKQIGNRMARCIRRDDTLGRFGGDEFVVILTDLPDSPLVITPVLENIRKAVAAPVLLDGQEVQVSASMGVVMYPRDGDDPTTLMMNADAAMYRAKDMGGNNYQFYRREMNASVEQKLLLLEGLRSAVDEQRFSLLYQPKVDLRTGRIFGVEALIRWHHPEHGLVPPARFISLAEESGLIIPIGEWVLATACAQNVAWRARGLPPISVSVNVSPRQFEDKRLVERVAGALSTSGLPASGLELEVTESLIMRDMQQAVERMRDLEAMGVALSIDDFGTGYSSLASLKSFPISSLKIDQSFVRDLDTSADDQAIAMAVISLGHKLNLRVIAEGVETEQQYRFLCENDCDEMQGYLFSRPVPADDIGRMLEQQQARGRAVPSFMLAVDHADEPME